MVDDLINQQLEFANRTKIRLEEAIANGEEVPPILLETVTNFIKEHENEEITN